jgi:3'-phosphoadenosine 5'-phosphosulfate sulfotransferase (PAPS reductase)/FAD synthetase
VRGRPRGYDAEWRSAASQIAAKNFEGLRTACPKCDEPGTIISKWVKGLAVKPLYVCHGNGNGRFKACKLGQTEIPKIRSEARLTRADVLKAIRMGTPYVLFSGGNDSLCLLHYMAKLAKSLGKEVIALHADTTAGFPEVEDFVRTVCKRWGVKLVIVQPPHDYFDLAKRWGIPGVKSRWCCETLKIAPMRRYLSGVEGPKVIFDGIRAAESHLRSTYVPIWFHPAFRCVSVSPIFNWSHQKVERYLKEKRLPRNPTHEMGTSGECWCGAYKSREDFEALLDVHPDIFDKLVAVEEAQRGRFTFVYEKGKRIPLSVLRSTRSRDDGRKRRGREC